jgi:hypothetical protein
MADSSFDRRLAKIEKAMGAAPESLESKVDHVQAAAVILGLPEVDRNELAKLITLAESDDSDPRQLWINAGYTPERAAAIMQETEAALAAAYR